MENTYTKSKKEHNPRNWFKDHLFCIREEDGYMTFLACMLFLALTALLFVCLDGSLIYQAKARVSMAQTGLTEHLLANYDVPLANRYHLYFLDPRMNGQTLEEEGQAYYKELFQGSSGMSLFSSPVWRMETEYLSVVPYGTMYEKECQFFIAQIEDCMKYDLTKDLLMKVLGNAAQETEKQADRLEETVKNLDKTNPADKGSQDSADDTLTPSDVAEGELAGSEVQKNNPLQKIRSILEYGVLGIVADEAQLSDRKIAPSLLPFQNQNEKKIALSMDILKNLSNIDDLITEQGLSNLTVNLTSQGALNLYIQKYFNSYKKENVIEDTRLLYEVEYILGGQNSDKENLEYVVNRLVLLRFALNAVYGFGNEELREEALALSAVLTGITGTPEFMEAVRYIILAAVNLIESVTDVEALLKGEKIPVVKTAADWKTSISGRIKESSQSVEQGLDYQGYVMILLTLQSDVTSKCYRMQNLMQINIQEEEPTFQIKECKEAVEIKTGVEVKPMFYLNEYLLEMEENAAY